MSYIVSGDLGSLPLNLRVTDCIGWSSFVSRYLLSSDMEKTSRKLAGDGGRGARFSNIG
jgi:hypothetical protein